MYIFVWFANSLLKFYVILTVWVTKTYFCKGGFYHNVVKTVQSWSPGPNFPLRYKLLDAKTVSATQHLTNKVNHKCYLYCMQCIIIKLLVWIPFFSFKLFVFKYFLQTISSRVCIVKHFPLLRISITNLYKWHLTHYYTSDWSFSNHAFHWTEKSDKLYIKSAHQICDVYINLMFWYILLV